MELLPDDAARRALLEQLAALLHDAGREPFLTHPMIEPSDRWFPDRWTPDEAGIGALIRRLLGYAKLELELTLDLDRFSESHGEVLADGRAGGHSGTAAWFAGIHDGVCSFGVDSNQLSDPEGLVGTLAHEVAHAYRAAHHLAIEDRDVEEQLTDLTTVYLGFGVLTTNGSQRFRSGSSTNGRSWYSRAEGGYLSMQSFTYLLAAQVVARGDAPRSIARLLATNQAACFKAACKDLGERDAVCARLGLPAPAKRGWFR